MYCINAARYIFQAEPQEVFAKAGITATLRGRQSAALDAFGAALGCVGLAGFAVIVWKFCRGTAPE